MTAMEALFQSLHMRKRPEDVADLVLQHLKDDLTRGERKVVQKAAQGSLRQRIFGYTSMLQDFARPVGLQTYVATAQDLFTSAYPLTPEACSQPDAVEQFIRHINEEIARHFGASNFLADRLDRHARRAAGLDLSKRQYNKRFRHLMRMEHKLHTLIQEQRKLTFTRVGKSGLAHMLSWDDFGTDPNTACFIAYYTARRNLRSEFTIYGQERPYDEIADTLFQRCQHGAQTNWWAIAHVFSTPEVLGHLTDEQKGVLLGMWFTLLHDIALLLKFVWERSAIDRSTMVVRRGNDSSTWNTTASAWNTARSAWIAVLFAMGAEEILETVCFGKVLRLMAADVVAWHRSAGGQLDPNTLVWNELPLPWEVLSGIHACPRVTVEEVCRKHGVDPIKAGWTWTPPPTRVASYKPTPELVHGVSVANPLLANVLRDAGFFSGKPAQRTTRFPGASTMHGYVLNRHHERLTGNTDPVE